jgi:hypothetical protein
MLRPVMEGFFLTAQRVPRGFPPCAPLYVRNSVTWSNEGMEASGVSDRSPEVNCPGGPGRGLREGFLLRAASWLCYGTREEY